MRHEKAGIIRICQDYDVSQILILISSVNSATWFGNTSVVQLKFISIDKLDHGIYTESRLNMVYFELRCRPRNRCNVTIVRALVIVLEIVPIQSNAANLDCQAVSLTCAYCGGSHQSNSLSCSNAKKIMFVQGPDVRNETISRTFYYGL